MVEKESINISEIEFHNEDGLMISKRIYISPIGNSTEIWINKEQVNQISFSCKQLSAFESFLNIEKVEMDLMQFKLKKYANEMIFAKTITKKSITSANSFHLNYSAVIIPQQDKTKKKYILILAETNWKIRYCNYMFEIEILFENNKFILLQEYSGLWTRLEWSYYYNTNKNTKSIE